MSHWEFCTECVSVAIFLVQFFSERSMHMDNWTCYYKRVETPCLYCFIETLVDVFTKRNRSVAMSRPNTSTSGEPRGLTFAEAYDLLHQHETRLEDGARRVWQCDDKNDESLQDSTSASSFSLARFLHVLFGIDNFDEETVLSWLEHLMFGTSLDSFVESFKRTHSSTVGSGVCGYVFKRMEPAYQCRTCGVDPTCIQCMRCFKNSDHRGHDTKMTHAGGGNVTVSSSIVFAHSIPQNVQSYF